MSRASFSHPVRRSGGGRARESARANAGRAVGLAPAFKRAQSQLLRRKRYNETFVVGVASSGSKILRPLHRSRSVSSQL